MTELYHWFDLIGIAVFAVTGTLVAHEKKMDGFGVVVLAAVTAIGGGTVRDLILDVPVFWLHDQSFFYAILAAVFITTRLINKQKSIPHYTLQIADAFGLGNGPPKSLTSRHAKYDRDYYGCNYRLLWGHAP